MFLLPNSSEICRQSVSKSQPPTGLHGTLNISSMHATMLKNMTKQKMPLLGKNVHIPLLACITKKQSLKKKEITQLLNPLYGGLNDLDCIGAVSEAPAIGRFLQMKTKSQTAAVQWRFCPHILLKPLEWL
jgi:hypothetical protein